MEGGATELCLEVIFGRLDQLKTMIDSSDESVEERVRPRFKRLFNDRDLLIKRLETLERTLEAVRREQRSLLMPLWALVVIVGAAILNW